VIIIDPRKLRFLRAGRTVTVTVVRPYRVGRDYAAGARRGHAVLRVRIIDCEATSGGWALVVRQHTLEPAVYLAASPGVIRSDYTIRLDQAAREVDGSPIEAVIHTRSTALAYDRDDAIRRERAAKQDKASRHRYAVASSLPRRVKQA
jgi:hypothetical protein